MSLGLHTCKETELTSRNFEQKGEAERKQRVVFRDQALGPVGRRVTVKCISRAANPLRKETATFFGPQSDTGTLFTGN